MAQAGSESTNHSFDIIQDKVPANIPVIFGADFGHVFPMITFPIGGTAKIFAGKDTAELQIFTHERNKT